jgi:hypothetical protein
MFCWEGPPCRGVERGYGSTSVTMSRSRAAPRRRLPVVWQRHSFLLGINDLAPQALVLTGARRAGRRACRFLVRFEPGIVPDVGAITGHFL